MNRSIVATTIALALLSSASARSLELNHYMAGMPNADDFFLPPPEAGRLIYAQYNVYYGTDTIRNHKGDRIDEITIAGPLNQPRTIDIDFNLDAFYLVPSLVWAPNLTLLGARFGAFAALPVGNPSLAADLNAAIGLGRSIDDSTWAVGDLYAQPLWLMWSFSRADLTASYGFYAPTGKYEGGETDNVGLGFWEHQIQNALRVHLDTKKTFAATVASTFEVAHDKKDADIVPGAHWTLNWAVRKNFFDDWAQLAVLGYDAFQISDDSGDDAPAKDKRHQDQVHAAGIQVGVPKLGLAVKYMHEFGARDRFEGQVVTLLFALPLEVIAEKFGILQ